MPSLSYVAPADTDLSTHSALAAPTDLRAKIDPAELKALQQRSDAKGLIQLAGHLAVILGSGIAFGFAWHAGNWWLALPLLLLYGFALVTMFAGMHESVHRTAYKSSWLNDGVGWVAGLLSFYNSTFYRFYHGWHHRFTQIPGKDPELADNKPHSFLGYLVELSAVGWWWGKLATYARIAFGRIGDYPYIPEKSHSEVIRSVRLQIAVYAAVIAVSIIAGQPWFLLFWLLPVAVGQPFLRAIVLSEHTGCSEDSNPLTNTRTTYTFPFVRFLMWQMPYHAEHHHYPALPFHALERMHAMLKPQLAVIAKDGYAEVQRGFIRDFRRPISA